MAKNRHIKNNSLVGPLFLERGGGGPQVVAFRGDGVIITDDATNSSIALTTEHFKSLIAAAPTIAAALA